MAAASCSPKASAAVIDSAATMSSPTSPRLRLVTISVTSASSTGSVATVQTALAQLAMAGEPGHQAHGQTERGEARQKRTGELEHASGVHIDKLAASAGRYHCARSRTYADTPESARVQ